VSKNLMIHSTKNEKSSKKPLISIITPVLNDARYLEQTIQSVITQDYDNIEYIIIDGGSTDGTVDIIKKYEDSIACWVSEPDEGIYDAQNKGAFRATGEYFAVLNSGDYYAETDVVSRFAQKIKQFSHADFIYSNAFLLKDTPDEKIVQSYSDIKNIRKRNPISHPTLFSRVKFFRESGGFDTSLKIAADYDYVCRLISSGSSGIKIDDFMVYIRQNGYSYLNLVSAKELFLIQKKYNKGPMMAYINYCFRWMHFKTLLLILKVVGQKNFNRIKMLRYFRI